LSRLLFISDLHLSPARPQLLQRFAELLRGQAAGSDGLYILGDLFDAWIGDDDPSPFAGEVKALLRDFSRGTPLFFQRGNRDFMVGDRFSAETGAVILEDEHLLETDGLRVLLMHGDQLCTDDREYQQVRALVRTPAFREQALQKSIEERIALAAEYRRRSGESQSLKPAEITDVNAWAVDDALDRHEAELLIHGHTHRPALHQSMLNGQRRRRLVLPDWRRERREAGALLEEGHLEVLTLDC